ncbi:hypothetical protein EDB19DRAFT_1832787 [Suillus lakei]|nr:hypothetical protein EDB19DRAFT_1832787 [Suillus lakei]
MIPGITGCYRSSGSVQFFVPFLLLFVFQLGLVSLSLIRVTQSWRTAKGPLHAVLVKHNIFYYACGLFFSAGNVLMPVLLSDVFILAILATRMHLNLWHMDQHVDDTDTLVWISLSDVSPVDRTSEVWIIYEMTGRGGLLGFGTRFTYRNVFFVMGHDDDNVNDDATTFLGTCEIEGIHGDPSSVETRADGVSNFRPFKKYASTSAFPSSFIRDQKMEYSADDVASATNLQFLTIYHVWPPVPMHSASTATFWWKFLLRSRWTKVKVLYIVTRYLPVVLIATNLHLNFTPNKTPNKCQILINIYSCLFVLRTRALWANNKIILVTMLPTLLAIFVVSIGTRFISTSSVTTSTIPGITGCYRTSRSVQFFMPFLLLFVFELGLVSLTLIRAIQDWRSTNGPLYAVLVKYNIFYYACSLFLSAVNILMPVLFSNSAYYSLLEEYAPPTSAANSYL